MTDSWLLQSDANSVCVLWTNELHEVSKKKSHFRLQKNKLARFWLQTVWVFYHTHGPREWYGRAYRHKAYYSSAGRSYLLRDYLVAVVVNSGCDFLLSITAQPSDAVLQSGQLAICHFCVELCHFFGILQAFAHTAEVCKSFVIIFFSVWITWFTTVILS